MEHSLVIAPFPEEDVQRALEATPVIEEKPNGYGPPGDAVGVHAARIVTRPCHSRPGAYIVPPGRAMPLHGNFACMPLPDVLQWLGNASKSGELLVERKKVVKRILVERGRIVGCGSDEPAERIGHFLVSRGRINEDHLRRALALQESHGRHLGATLIEMGAIAEDELVRALEQKAEETIFSLFEWEDASFRFQDGAAEQDGFYPVDLRVEDVLLRGAQRWDEVQRIREVFHDPGIVLRTTSRKPPQEIYRNRLARRVFESINGERTVAEILLHAHASEFVVTRFLYELHRGGIVAVAGLRDLDAETPASPEPSATTPAISRGVSTETAGESRAAVVAPPPPPATTLEGDLGEARARMDRGDFEAALDLLDRRYRAEPGSDALRRLLAEAEMAFVEKAYRHYLPAEKVLTLDRSVEELTGEALSPAEFFLLSRIDGTWNVKSIVQITPLREVEALRTLKHMRERGIISLRDPV